MSRDDIQKLLGGYATGTLTAEEQHVLFEAALQDQELFDALAREQSLRDLLRDPASRAHLLAALDSAPEPWYRGWWRKPAPLGALALVAAFSVVAIVVVRPSRSTKPVMVAKADLPVAVAPAPAPASPASPVAEPAPIRREAKPAAADQISPARNNPVGSVNAEPAPTANAPANKLVSTTENVQVSASAQNVQTTPVEQGQALADRQLKELPANTRNALLDSRTDAALGKPKSAALAPPPAVPPPPAVAPPQQALPAQLQQLAVQQQPLQQATSGFVASEVRAKAEAVAPLSIEYRVVRKLPGGAIVDVDPDDGEVPAGTPLNLQITPSEDGYLRILEGQPGGGWRERANVAVSGRKVFETAPLQFDATGRKQLQVSFSRRPFDTAAAAADEKKDLAKGTLGGALPAGLAGARGGGGGRAVTARGAAAKKSTNAVPSHVAYASGSQAVAVVVTLNVH